MARALALAMHFFMSGSKEIFLNLLKRIGHYAVCVAWCFLALWASGVVVYNVWGGVVFVWFYVIGLIVSFCFRKKSLLQWQVMRFLPVLLWVYYLMIPASNDKVWQAPWSRIPVVEISGNHVTVKDVRSFVYRSEQDYDVRYVTRQFDLDKLSTLDFAVSHWDGMEAVAHTMLSFGFEDGRHLALSVETRLPEGVLQENLPGIYKQYNLAYILADEQDLFALRTHFRREDMYLYRVKMSRSDLRKVFIGFAEKINHLHKYPRFYNTITANCTTELVDTFKHYLGVLEWHWTPIFNGICDENSYRRGELLTLPNESFSELKKRSYLGYGSESVSWADIRRRWENSFISTHDKKTSTVDKTTP